ncbi:HNH endonuclease family protein [Plantactinospora sp. KLBMP9567]|uniref:HNH endonuclease family protein n=1 Tax=Plantactinospora sp. KLBMP9567 TaxID=3085900 RepID=UPI002982AFDD|nr:HNH endonuclease family protein [Plantactinospora sp. KLBMP9567]MDW5325605.1 HNH endonuclease family protein [Plantactinospora sp. KLBMP9567]
MRTRSLARSGTAAVLAGLLAAGAAACAPVESPAPEPTGSADTQAQLDRLTVAGAGSMRGYSRERFPHWRNAGKNCDVRDTVLQRDGTGIKLSGCNVVGGRWSSRYDKRTLTDPSDVDIDHMVPLANAWRSGADEWDDDKRSEFANDLDRPQLVAVSASSNRAKGDQDPSQWKPSNRDDWCQYAEDWIAVKHYWRLSVTSGEKAALDDMLGSC